ncbi:hypothetical protein CL616_03430 [archaeon]|nr:hypothetical protein [archaeon]
MVEISYDKTCRPGERNLGEIFKASIHLECKTPIEARPLKDKYGIQLSSTGDIGIGRITGDVTPTFGGRHRGIEFKVGEGKERVRILNDDIQLSGTYKE